MYPHRIRLRGPWDCEGVAGPVRMPCRWDEPGLKELAGSVRFRRRFGYPGRLDADERVWLTFAGVFGDMEVVLNGRPLAVGPESGFELDVTSLLQQRNVLEVTVHKMAKTSGPWDEVALEIRRAESDEP